ncbi:polysaccharide deacetylase family protein [Sphingomonas sp. CGMCC 1.13654]|uniref:Polysaccharide deacetylase family protein n=1 Tax=Sphingomonas chungangi TaxID=2683589 RepID=A0A838LA11_9SPHN|nr:polysaccharide deacetylase family protein [Sphingomonas chungangi]MBA2936014.1 polysaccharide deacetylase family protein [Sphingomonas chungangi]MVW55404.1 polysaccharide deacetylase family protein [Sphingomonas chungangi]
MTGVLLSIDTEFTWRAHEGGAGWLENYQRSIEPGGAGITYQLATLGRHGLKACFFVDPLPALLFGIEPIERIVGTILDAGQEVQLHLHPMWTQADRRVKRTDPVRFELTQFSEDEQLALILQARELLRQAGAPDPVAFRAGSFAANVETLRAIQRAGFRIDSSHNGSLMPWPCDTGLPETAMSPLPAGKLIELPVGLIDEGAGKLRHLQVGAVSLTEMRAALLHAELQGSPLVTLVGHSFELATRDGERANDIVRHRFDSLCAWLGGAADRFPTCFITDLLDVALDVPATPCPVSQAARLGRMAMQGLSNLRYERRF